MKLKDILFYLLCAAIIILALYSLYFGDFGGALF